VRTYNFPQDRVTDHRVGVTITGVDRVMNGQELDQLTEALMKQDQVCELPLKVFKSSAISLYGCYVCYH